MIRVQNLTKRYAGRTAVENLSFEVAKGEIVGFLGPNGAGKSTTMKILTGYMPASEGTASVAGFDVFESSMEVKRNVGFLPETPPVYREMPVREYLEFTARLHQVAKDQLRASVDRALEKTYLSDVAHRLIGNLSKGYRQRVGIAQALVHNPQVLILDEPTVGLDPKQIIEIRKLIKELAGDHTVILSTHILPEVQTTCDRVIVINKGRIAAQDTLSRLTAQLQQGRTFRLLVRKPSREGIDALRAISGVKGVVESSNESGTLQLELGTEAPDLRETIAETVVSRGMGLLEFGAETLSLEEVFLQLTTRETAVEENA